MTTRLLIAVLAGVLAAGGLAGCRSDPGVAAYVGDAEITEAQVDTMMADLPALVERHNAARGNAAPDSPQGFEAVMPSRDTVVSTMVFAEVCRQLPAGGEEPAREVPEAEIARGDQLPVGSRFLRARVDYFACLDRIAGQAQPATPTEEQLREFYNRALAAEFLEPGQTFEDVAPQLAANQQVRNAYGVRQPLVEAVQSRTVTVNPRYRPLELPLLFFTREHAAVVVPLSPVDPNPAVRDAG